MFTFQRQSPSLLSSDNPLSAFIPKDSATALTKSSKARVREIWRRRYLKSWVLEGLD